MNTGITSTQYVSAIETENEDIGTEINLGVKVRKLDPNTDLSQFRGVATTNIMGINEQFGDNAADVTYSTKPNSFGNLGEITKSYVI